MGTEDSKYLAMIHEHMQRDQDLQTSILVNLSAINTTLSTLAKQLDGLNTTVNGVTVKLALVSECMPRLETLNNRVNKLEAFKNKLIGVSIATSIVVGALVSWLGKFIFK